jgi:hypothetical protein
VPTLFAVAVWLLQPEWRGRRLFTRWLFVTVAIVAVFILVNPFVRPVNAFPT